MRDFFYCFVSLFSGSNARFPALQNTTVEVLLRCNEDKMHEDQMHEVMNTIIGGCCRLEGLIDRLREELLNLLFYRDCPEPRVIVSSFPELDGLAGIVYEIIT